jgi:protein ImuB
MNGAARQLHPEAAGLPPAPVGSEYKAGRPPAAPLWLCLGLPRLPLEVRGEGEDEDARIVVDREGRVVRASRLAAEQGVAVGLPLNAALALCPGLLVLARDEAAERDALHRLAAWAGAFTPVVSLTPPAALLLEVRGSLRLFGGLESLRRRLRHALRATGHAGREAVAPTPLAALWLARAGDDEAVTDAGALPGRLGRLPPAVTGWPEKTLAVLRDLGVESLADCLRLPRDGFARRVGRGPLEDLDRALGRLADPRPSFRAPPRYRAELELATETTDTERLGRAMRPLFAELEGFLRGRQRAVSRVAIRFMHLQRAATALTLGLAGPALEATRFQAVFEQHLERLALPAPVIGLALEAEPGEPLGSTAAGLFGDEPDAAAGLRLVERLRARLGRDAVHGVVLRDEHRPERAWAVAEPAAAAFTADPVLASPAARRPAWLLETPRALRSVGGCPWCDGALSMESGPERLETGWWDGGEVARDYWIARTPAGARLWIFRERPGPAGEPRWYLHGVFG